jgi:hypothetical protein
MSKINFRRALVVGAAAALVLVTGCTSASSGSVPTSPSPAGSSAVTPSSAGTPGTTASAPATAPVTIDISITGDQVSPNGEKINVEKGQTVVLNVTSDMDDEIHAHTSGDGYELEVTAGKAATGQFVASDTGSFEVESHHLEKVIAILVVR